MPTKPTPKSPALPKGAQAPLDLDAEELFAKANDLRDKDPDGDTEALLLFLQAAELGHAVAMVKAGLMLLGDSQGIAVNRAQGLAWLRKAETKDNAQAQMDLGYLYSSGNHIKADPAKGIRHWHRAAELGLPQAQYWLGSAYKWGGQTFEQDEAKAVDWWDKACRGGHPQAIRELAGLLEQGSPAVPQDLARTAALYDQGVRAGDPNCLYPLGMMYLEGRGVAQDLGEAFRLFSQSVAQKENGMDISSLLQLAQMHETGQGVPVDLAKAFGLYLQIVLACAEGTACRRLAHILERGLTVQNPDLALMLYQSAANAGSEEAVEALKRLGAPLT